MQTLKAQVAGFHRVEDLKPILAGAQSPCLTVYFSLNATAIGEANEKNQELRWREIIRGIESKAEQYGAAGRDLVSAIETWDAIRDGISEGGGGGRSIAVFRSADIFHVAPVTRDLPDRAVLGPNFFIRPLLAGLVRDSEFYLLALSEKNPRLLHCTINSSEEVHLPPGTPTDFNSWLNQAKPDHNDVDNAMTTGVQGSAGPSALAPKGSDREKKDQYLAHYFKQLDNGVNQVLKGKSEPLVICGVEYELPIFRDINRYPHLIPEEVRGAPNSLKSGEMHARAIAALERWYATKLDQALAEWNHRVGGGASSRLKEVVTASFEGRILTLLISDSEEKIGVYDEQTHSVKAKETGSASDEEILNEAAIQTILHAGKVLVVPHHKMPNGSPAAAIFRY